MQRVTAPVDEDRRPSEEAIQFAADAKLVLDEAARDLAIPRADEAAPARKRAATLPPIRPPTVPPFRPPTMPPSLGRRSPTMPPLPAQLFGARPPTSPPNVTVPPSDTLRPPAQPTPPPAPPAPHATVPPPDVLRAPGPNLLDDMVTLRPSYEKRPDLDVKEGDDGSVLIQPRAAIPPMPSDDASTTQPRMAPADDDSIGEVTSPNIEIPEHAREPRPPKTSWATSLADRIDRQLDDDVDDAAFEPDATRQQSIEEIERLHRQGLLDRPEDATKQLSVDDIERLHRDGALDRPSDPELSFSRRTPFPTAEIDDADIEAAIELAPPARRSSIGIAKKKPPE